MATRKQKECSGCGDLFFTFKNYDYCANCAINNNRYLTKSHCSECDGSGRIKFKNQKPRPCKLCFLTKKSMTKKNTKLSPEEKYWNAVETKTHYLIADLLNQKLPLSNLRKKENLDLEKDADYRTLLSDYENAYSEEDLPSEEQLAEQIAYEYLILVSKSILQSLSAFNCHNSEYFDNLTN